MYLYRDHLEGGIYATKAELSWQELQCEECGDSDTSLGECDDWYSFINIVVNEDGRSLCYAYAFEQALQYFPNDKEEILEYAEAIHCEFQEEVTKINKVISEARK